MSNPKRPNLLSSLDQTAEKLEEGFKKLSGLRCNFHGPCYQILLTCYAMIRAHEEGREYKLYTESKLFGSLDDIILLKPEENEAILVQAKHTFDTKVKLTKGELFKKSDFFLSKYIEDFEKASQIMPAGAIKEVILCTNRQLSSELKNEIPKLLIPVTDPGIVFAGIGQAEMYKIEKNVLINEMKNKGIQIPVSSALLEEFVQKFCFFTNVQMNDIKKELSLLHKETLGLDFEHSSPEELISRVSSLLDATKQKSHLSNHDMDSYIAFCKARLYRTFFAGSTDLTLSELLPVRVKYGDTTMPLRITEFLEENSLKENIINYVTEPDYVLGMTKITQRLREWAKDSFAVVTWTEFQNKKNDLMACSLKLSDLRSFLIVVIFQNTSEQESVRDFNTVGFDQSARIILISSTKLLHDKNVVVDDMFGFQHLTQDSKQALLKGTNVMLQGKQVVLQSIISEPVANTLLTEEDVALILKGNLLTVGSLPHSDTTSSKFYCERTYKRKCLIHNDNLPRDSYIDCESHADFPSLKPLSDKLDQQEYHVFTSTKQIGNNLLQWLTTVGAKGKIEEIRRNAMDWNNCGGKTWALNVTRRPIILCGEPGSGKTIELNEAVKTLVGDCSGAFENASKPFIVVHFSLNQFASEIKLLDNSLEGTKSFLMKAVEINSGFEKKLFLKLVEDGQLNVFLDGFDEICPQLELDFERLAKSINDLNPRRFLITSRNVMRPRLENAFNELSFELEPLREQDQVQILQRFLDFADESQAKVIVKKINRNSSCKGILEIPLHVSLVAEVYENDPSLQNLDILSLFENYVHFKNRKFLSEKQGANISFNLTQRDLDHRAQLSLELLALDAYFTSPPLDRSEKRDILESKKRFEEETIRLGIVTYLSGNNKAIFIHRAVQEFLIAKWFGRTECLDDDEIRQFVKVNLFNLSNFNIRRFFDLILARDCGELHYSIVSTGGPGLCNMSPSDLAVVDKAGRNTLMICFSYEPYGSGIPLPTIEKLRSYGDELDKEDKFGLQPAFYLLLCPQNRNTGTVLSIFGMFVNAESPGGNISDYNSLPESVKERLNCLQDNFGFALHSWDPATYYGATDGLLNLVFHICLKKENQSKQMNYKDSDGWTFHQKLALSGSAHATFSFFGILYCFDFEYMTDSGLSLRDILENRNDIEIGRRFGSMLRGLEMAYERRTGIVS